MKNLGKLDSSKDVASLEYVLENSSKIDSISVDGVPTTIDEHKNVDIHIPSVVDASSSAKGIAKLYTNLGNNTDGSVTQSVVNTNVNTLQANINNVAAQSYTKTESDNLYLTKSAASSTYLTQSSASSTYAPKASPAFSGTPTAPTATAGTNTTQIATTAFVTNGLSGKANSSHTHAASTISAGTFAGQVIANASAIATLTTGQVRNIYISTSAPTSSQGNNGDIWIKYTA